MFQKDVALQIEVTEYSVFNWEANKVQPKINQYPKVIEFLGYFPFEIDTSTLGGKIKAYRYTNGLNRKKFCKTLGVNESTLKSWEDNAHSPMPQKMKILQLYLSNQI